MRIPDSMVGPLLELDALLLGGTVRRAVRNYGSADPAGRDDGSIGPSEIPEILRGIRRERALAPGSFIRPCETPRFIGATTGRSGTTWLKNVMDKGLGRTHLSVREVGLFDLVQFRGAPYEYLQYANLPQRGVYRRFFRDFILNRAFFIRRRLDGTMLGLCDLLPKRAVEMACDELDARLEESRTLGEIEKSFGDFYLWLFNGHAELVAGGRPWISKEPPYGRNADQLLRMIPDARLIVLVRDGRDVALSMSEHGWHPTVRHAVDRWCEFTTMTKRALSRCPSDRYLVVRYRDLVTEFGRSCEAIMDFLELPTLDHDSLKKADLLPNPSSLERWKREMSSEDRAYFAESCAGLMNHFGLP